MEAILTTVGGQSAFVYQPRSSPRGARGVDLVAALNHARRDHAALCVLDSDVPGASPLSALVPDGVPVIAPRGVTRQWLRARWRSVEALRAVKGSIRRASSGFWWECHRELRRQAGDDRLPADLRVRVRERAQALLSRSQAAGSDVTRFPRRWLRERVAVTLPPALDAEARATAAASGVATDGPLVAVEIRRRPDLFEPAMTWLQDRGYSIVRIGDTRDAMRHSGVIELSHAAAHAELLDVFVLLTARFVVCDSLDVQHTSYATNTPSLLLNAPDAFSGYPVRHDGLFTLRTAIDVDTGETLQVGDQLGERYFRNLRNCGFRDNSATEILAGVQEMHEGVTVGWREDEDQRRFRDATVEAGAALLARVPLVARWGPDDGFIGDGRLARWQASRATPGPLL